MILTILLNDTKLNLFRLPQFPISTNKISELMFPPTQKAMLSSPSQRCLSWLFDIVIATLNIPLPPIRKQQCLYGSIQFHVFINLVS